MRLVRENNIHRDMKLASGQIQKKIITQQSRNVKEFWRYWKKWGIGYIESNLFWKQMEMFLLPNLTNLEMTYLMFLSNAR